MLFEKEIGKLGFGLMRLPKKDNVNLLSAVRTARLPFQARRGF